MKYLSNIAFALVILALTACADFLDKDPDERTTVDTEDKVVMLLGSAYSEGNWGFIAEMSSDNMMDNNCPHLPFKSSDAQVLTHYNLASYNGYIDDEIFRFDPGVSSTGTDSPYYIWENTYEAIATANMALESIDELVAEAGGEMSAKLRAARAEALLCRAHNHFILVNLFSQAYKDEEASKNDVGIPYIKNVETTVSPHYDRGSVTETYANIEEDLIAGLADITDDNYDLPKWHFNVNAAHAFAARFYLYKREYEKVIEHADYVLGEGTSLLSGKLMDYSEFDDCTSSSDYRVFWQAADEPNNLLLIPTHSRQWRAAVGYRYSCTSTALTEVYYHTNANSNWSVIPTVNVGGYNYYRSNTDYGRMCCKICESFEYTNKVAGIGYAHIIRREYTGTELLLDRAEAKIMLHDIDGAVEDMIAYDDNRYSFSDEIKAKYTANNSLRQLTKELIDSYYSVSTHYNCYKDWDFTQNMSSSFVVPEDCVTYMNCLNEERRFELWETGWRFFDLKRYGIEYSHLVGLESTEYYLTWDDERRAIEVPQAAIVAGLEPSRVASLPVDDTYPGNDESLGVIK